MKTLWTNGLKGQELADVKQAFKSSGTIRARLATILEEERASSYREATSKSSYDNPNWALLQADAKGYERAMLKVISWLDNK
jgi:hypothetical protein